MSGSRQDPERRPEKGPAAADRTGGSPDHGAILASLATAVYSVDAAGRLTYFNDAAAELWGRRPEPGDGLWCGARRLFWPDGSPMRPEESPLAVAVKEGLPLHGVEAMAEQPDGALVQFLAYATPVRDDAGKVSGGVATLIDISDRKAIAEVGPRLKAIIEGSDDAIVSKDLNGIITSWNDGAQRLFGYAAEEAVGRSITMLIPVDRLPEEDDILSRIRRGERVGHFDTVRRHKSGRMIQVAVTVSPMRSQSGRIIGASKIARDISQRKEAEHRIRMLMREVNHRVKNQFAVILAMVRETNKRARSPQDFERQIRERIMALSRSHDLLVNGEWRGATLRDLILSQVEPFDVRDRIVLTGPDVVLQHNAVQYLGIAFHELATNSAKYGALSNRNGRIEVSWSTEPEPDGAPHFRLGWTESGGPPAGDEPEGGFGTVVLRRVAPAALSGVATLDYPAGGMRWSLDAPMTFVAAEAAAEQP